MYPTLIFFYGPVDAQNEAASRTFSSNIGYSFAYLPLNANIFLQQFKKSVNYVINGLFTSK
jgi:hypothetical protein